MIGLLAASSSIKTKLRSPWAKTFANFVKGSVLSGRIGHGTDTAVAHAKDLKPGEFIPGKTLLDVARVLHQRWCPFKGNWDDVRRVVNRLSSMGCFVQSAEGDLTGFVVVEHRRLKN